MDMVHTEDFMQALEEHGELIVTLASGDEYELHRGNTEIEHKQVTVEGTLDGEQTELNFHVDDVEQYKKHFALQ